MMVKPDTVIGWHRRGFRFYWRWKSRRGRMGRPGTPKEIRELIREMSNTNVLWGAPRLHGELLKLGIEVSPSTVAKYMVTHRKPPSQTWRTFLENDVRQLVSVDLFIVPTVSFRILYVFVVLAHERRRVVHFNVTERPTAEWTAQQMVETICDGESARYLIRDRDGVYGLAFRDRVRALDIEEVVIAPHSPWQNAYAERVIGTLRRECLDHVVVLGETHLRRTLTRYFRYYHDFRTHLSLEKDAPTPRAVQDANRGPVIEVSEVGGLHHQYERRAA